MKFSNVGKRRTLRGHLATVAVAGAAALAAAGTVGAGVANAGTNSAGPPSFNTTQASASIRGSGSDTTFFLMQKISDYYTAAGLYGCQLVSAAGQAQFNTGASSTAGNVNQNCQANSADIATTDNGDNWNRVEVEQGVNNVGSGSGQNQLCGKINDPVGLQVDFARSSKPSANLSGCNEEQLGYAKDGVPIVDFPSINPSSFGTSSQPGVAAGAYPAVNNTSINGGVVGPIAAGWLPGDNPAGTANHGTKPTTISNLGAEDTSVAFRMWCLPHGSATSIGDWGQLTNLGPNIEVNVTTSITSPIVTIAASSGTAFPSTIASGNAVTDPFSAPAGTPFASGTTSLSAGGGSTLTLSNNATATGTYTLTFATGAAKLAVGSGVPVGIPIRIQAVNTGSGTSATFAGFANGQTPDPSSPCTSSSVLDNENGANDPNSATATLGDPVHVALENNAHQIELFSQADFADTADQAIEEAETLYFMGFGAYSTNAYIGETTIGATNFAANIIGENGIFPSSTTEINNSFPTARTLFNIVNATTVRNSVGGFLNWICDSNSIIPKSTDLSTGLNLDAELSNTISTQFGFPRLSDTSLPVATGTPADNLPSPNDSCVAQIPVTVAGDGVTITEQGGGNFPTDLINGGSVIGSGVPASTTLTSAGGGVNITLSNSLPAGNTTLEFTGVPGIVSVSGTP